MSKNENVKFTCRECGAHELGYQKYAKCINPVSLQENGHMEYGISVIDEDDYLCADNCFICLNCKSFVEHCGFRKETEQQLRDYLSMNSDVRKKEEMEHGEYIDGQIYAQEQKEEEQSNFEEEISAAEKLACTD